METISNYSGPALRCDLKILMFGRGVIAGLRLVRLKPPGEGGAKLDTLDTLRFIQYGEEGPKVTSQVALRPSAS